MKICVTSEEKTFDSPVSFRFGRSGYFLFIDLEKQKILEVIENPAVGFGRGAGVSAAQTVVDKKATAVITGRVGPNAYNALSFSKVKIYDGAGLTVSQAVENLKKDQLSILKNAEPGFGRCLQ